MSEKISRDDLKQQQPALYQEYLDYHELNLLKEQAITHFDITRSPKQGRVHIVGVHYSELHTMYCDECKRTYSENEYIYALRHNHGWMPCGHAYMECYDIESSEVK